MSVKENMADRQLHLGLLLKPDTVSLRYAKNQGKVYRETIRLRLDVTYMSEYVSVMNTKLTLRMGESLVEKGKFEANRRGKSVSQMVGDFFDSLSTPNQQAAKKLPPLTASLVGVLKGHRTDADAYKKHLREKHHNRF